MSQLLTVTLICNCICHNLYLYLCWNLYLHFCISHSPQINYIDFDLLLYLVHFILVFVSKVVFASLWLWVYCICIEIRICSCSFVFHTFRKLLRFVTSALYSMHQRPMPISQKCETKQLESDGAPNYFYPFKQISVCFEKHTLHSWYLPKTDKVLSCTFTLPKMFVNLYKLVSSSKCRTQNVWKS